MRTQPRGWWSTNGSMCLRQLVLPWSGKTLAWAIQFQAIIPSENLCSPTLLTPKKRGGPCCQEAKGPYGRLGGDCAILKHTLHPFDLLLSQHSALVVSIDMTSTRLALVPPPPSPCFQACIHAHVLYCFVLFALQLSVCLWWHDYR
jgi:hypothetical protein